MTAPQANFSDLARRVLSGAAIAALCFFALWLGGGWFLALTAAIIGLMVWELERILEPGTPVRAAGLALLSAGALVVARTLLPVSAGLALLAVSALAGGMLLDLRRWLFIGYAAAALLAGYAILALRAELGFIALLWFALVVIVTDIFGYFAGRLIGGPKFWPRISPKKTWSGTVAGWVAAALVGLGFAGLTGAGSGLVVLSVALSLVSQIGDICESALKRQSGAKDSSNLLPGHGGLFDRFDGMLAATIALWLLHVFAGTPQLPGV